MTSVLKNTTVCGVIETFYLNEDVSDVHFLFKVDDDVQKVPANKTILALLSPVFYAMFFGSLKEKGDVEIVHTDVGSFKEFLRFFYVGEVTLTMKNVEAVFRLADMYDVPECVDACTAFLKSKLTLDNICWGYELALLLENKELIDFCERKIVLGAEIIFATDVFQRCEKSTLKRILQLELRCKEIDVFNACLVWAKYACKQNNLDETQAENLKSQLGDCLKLIRFGTMTAEEQSTIATLNDGLFTPDEFKNIMSTLTVPKILYHIPFRLEDLFYCYRDTDFEPPFTEYYLQNLEVVWFTSNQPLLLGAFETKSLHDNFNSLGSASVIITEMRKDSSKRILYEDSSIKWFRSLIDANFTTPIPILPQYMYEIRLTMAQTGFRYTRYGKAKQTVNLTKGYKSKIENDYTIQFHCDPSHPSDDTPSSEFIDCLTFNKI